MKVIHSKTGVRQLNRETTLDHRKAVQLAFFLQDWQDPYNVGGMFRVASACGATEMFCSGNTPHPDEPQVAVTSLGHHRRVRTRCFATNDEAVAGAKAAGYTLIAVEIAEQAVPYFQFDFPEKSCLVLGNEVRGISGKVLQACDAAVFIPMSGKGRSLNVHVAAAVVGFHSIFCNPV